MSKVEFYRCESCGNLVALMKEAKGELTCCNQPMTKLEANVSDAAEEKHVPHVVEEEDVIRVSVGSTIHPMLPEHYIEWIALATDNEIIIKHLKPGEHPVVEFENVKDGTVFAYCNLHDLWKKDLQYIIPNEVVCSPEFPDGCISV
ncbi:MAG TPA: desulfoferrodoxin FeS4 iron-binding domain-containing protein [Candidatus Merdenecus merdavium]|nr:desulfoferrodoxin FeS4 iron-binding domain-containing protein [Candidatus Merdenecus merdavium]